MSLTTPDRIRTLQRKLYGKAKAEPAFRFYLLFDKICRADILADAYALARHNDGAPGVDGVCFEDIERSGVAAWLAGLREDLDSMAYRPMPVRRVMIPKPGGWGAPIGHPHDPGSGGADRRQAGAGTDHRGGYGRLCLWIQAQKECARRDRRDGPAIAPGLHRCGRRARSYQGVSIFTGFWGLDA